MERPVQTVTEHRQVLVDFLGGDLTVLLRSDDVCVSQHPAYTLDGDTLAQGQRREPMAGAMESDRLRKEKQTEED